MKHSYKAQSALIILLIIFISTLGLTSCHKEDAKQPAPLPEEPVQNQPDTTKSESVTQIQQGIESISKAQKLEDVGPASEEETQLIRSVYSDFKEAVLGYHGTKAASMMAESSLNYYGFHLAIARMMLHQPEEYKKVEPDLSATIRSTVLLMKERLSPSYIDTATPFQLYETAFNQGWIGYRTLSTASIDKIHVYMNHGKRYLTGDFYYSGTFKDNRVMRIGFVEENDAWKVDLLPLFIDLDQKVEFFFFKERADRDLSINNSIEQTNKAMEPKNWKPSVQKKDAFAVNFPRAPLYAENNGENIYTSQDYRYGQFDVRVLYYPSTDEDSPFYQKGARDQDLLRFIKPLNVSSPKCSMHELSKDTMIKCDLDIPDHQSRAKAVWIFTQDRRYLIFNLARNDQYDDEVAATYMQSFSYGLPQTP